MHLTLSLRLRWAAVVLHPITIWWLNLQFQLQRTEWQAGNFVYNVQCLAEDWTHNLISGLTLTRAYRADSLPLGRLLWTTTATITHLCSIFICIHFLTYISLIQFNVLWPTVLKMFEWRHWIRDSVGVYWTGRGPVCIERDVALILPVEPTEGFFFCSERCWIHSLAAEPQSSGVCDGQFLPIS